MVNWEFFDNQTPESAVRLVDDLRAGATVRPTRGASLRTFKEVSRVLAGFPDGLADEGGSGGPATFVGLEVARERGDSAPEPPARRGAEGKSSEATDRTTTGTGAGSAPTEGTGYGAAGGPSGSDASAKTSESDDASTADPASPEGNVGTDGTDGTSGTDTTSGTDDTSGAAQSGTEPTKGKRP
jgi:NADH-quinone oxidoreductase subunit E